MDNKCLKYKCWNGDDKTCSYDPCDYCIYDLATSDGVCNLPECKYGHDASPESWNLYYNWNTRYE